jgi:hypothetical protein
MIFFRHVNVLLHQLTKFPLKTLKKNTVWVLISGWSAIVRQFLKVNGTVTRKMLLVVLELYRYIGKRSKKYRFSLSFLEASRIDWHSIKKSVAIRTWIVSACRQEKQKNIGSLFAFSKPLELIGTVVQWRGNCCSSLNCFSLHPILVRS